MSTIRKKTNKDKTRYQALIRLSNHPTVSKTFNLKSYAIAWARETEIQIEKGVVGTNLEELNKTVFDLLERYLTEITPKKRGHKVEKYRIEKLKRSPISLKKNKSNKTIRYHKL